MLIIQNLDELYRGLRILEIYQLIMILIIFVIL